MMRASSSALIAVLSLTACVTVDDRDLTEHAAKGTHRGTGGRGGTAGDSNGGSSGKGGSSLTGGSSGKGGSSATGGSSGKGGSSATGGSSGKGGSGGFGAAEDCDGDPIDVDEELVRACLMQTGCNPFVPSTSLSFCISNQRLSTFRQDDCGTGATSCDDFLACHGQGFYEPSDCTSGEPVYCETETLGVSCSRFPYAIDCAKFGGVCATYTDDAGDLRVWCRIPDLDGCTESPDTRQCDPNGRAYTCIGGTAYGDDCPLIGSECRDGSCYYVLPACSTPGATCGTAARLDLCYDSGDLAHYECAAGLGCEESTTSAACSAPGCADAPPCAESCSGNELTFCYGGAPVTLDCTDYGFRRCVEIQPTAAGDDVLAYCAYPQSAQDRACEVTDTDSTCGSCAKEECCPSWTACLDNRDCVDFINCATDCAGVSTCISDCRTEHSLGSVSYDAFIDCRDMNCGC